MKRLTSSVKLREGAKLKHPMDLPITIELELASCPEFDTHHATFCYQDTTSTVTDDSGNEVGSISAGIGGQLFVRDAATEYDYVLDPRKLWFAVQEALKKKHSFR